MINFVRLFPRPLFVLAIVSSSITLNTSESMGQVIETSNIPLQSLRLTAGEVLVQFEKKNIFPYLSRVILVFPSNNKQVPTKVSESQAASAPFVSMQQVSSIFRSLRLTDSEGNPYGVDCYEHAYFEEEAICNTINTKDLEILKSALAEIGPHFRLEEVKSLIRTININVVEIALRHVHPNPKNSRLEDLQLRFKYGLENYGLSKLKTRICDFVLAPYVDFNSNRLVISVTYGQESDTSEWTQCDLSEATLVESLRAARDQYQQIEETKLLGKEIQDSIP